MKLSVSLLLLGLVSSTLAGPFDATYKEEWELFKYRHNKQYVSSEIESFRMKVFAENKLKIAQHNQLYEMGKETYMLGVNQFTDMMNSEVVSMMNGFRGYSNYQSEAVTFIGADDDVVLPESVNWSTKGAVTPIKNQGQCGSCWAFSTTGSLEGQHFRKTGKLVSLSEQNLVDCSGAYGNLGCNGGLMDNAFKYIKANGGIDTENSYPYTAMEGTCHYSNKTIGAEVTGFVDIHSGNEKALMKAVATIGPISVAIDASHQSFQLYKSGVYSEPDCGNSPGDLDHGVLAVGYGTDENGVDYWLVKNSWTDSWGEAGYIKMSRNKKNQCGIATSASYPLV